MSTSLDADRVSPLLRLRWSGRADGIPLVFGNSLGTDTSLWDEQVEALAKRFKVLRFDYPGHGGNEGQGVDTIEGIANHLAGQLLAEGITRFHYCGLSMGGAVGMALAAAYPERLTSLVLSNTAAEFGSEDFWLQRIRTAEQEGLPSIAVATVARWLTSEHAQRDPALVAHLKAMFCGTSLRGYVECCHAVRTFNGWPMLAKIVAPTLVIGGEHDEATPVERAHDLRRAIRGAHFRELPAAHLGNLGAPAQFTSTLAGFLEQHHPSSLG